MVPKRLVDVPGIGRVPNEFTVATKRFDIDPTPESFGNGHNESRIKTTCSLTGWEEFTSDFLFAKDDLYIDWQPSSGGNYRLDLRFNSESPVALWGGNGRISFEYDASTEQWKSPRAFVNEKGVEREWQFCAPQSVFTTALVGIRCFILNSVSAEADALNLILASIDKQGHGGLVGGMSVYDKSEDCSYVLPAELDHVIPVMD